MFNILIDEHNTDKGKVWKNSNLCYFDNIDAAIWKSEEIQYMHE